MNHNQKPSVILFDVNETLMDMSPLKKEINALLKNEMGFKVWFNMLLHYSLVDNCIIGYHDFSAIANATLGMAAKLLECEIGAEEKQKALATTKQLHAYSDVAEGLKMLHDAGYRLATLTNSPPDTLKAQLDNSGIAHFFEAALSIDEVQKYKPSAEAYEYAAHKMSVTSPDMLMVAAHGWDIAGALKSNMQAAFIARPGQSLYPLAPAPHFTGKNLPEVARAIINQYA